MAENDKRSMEKIEITKIPEPSTDDHLNKVMKVALSAIPGVGGTVVEIFNSLIEPPITKRKDEWIQSIAIELVQLQEQVKDLKLENLIMDESFISTLIYASQVALRTHQKEKHEALKNAIVNAAIKNSPDDDVQLIFLNLVDAFTSWHLKILVLLDDPIKYGQEKDITWPNWSSTGLKSLIHVAFPLLEERLDFTTHIVKDLYSHGLIDTDSIGTTMSRHGVLSSRTSPMGKQFLTYIRSPFPIS